MMPGRGHCAKMCVITRPTARECIRREANHRKAVAKFRSSNSPRIQSQSPKVNQWLRESSARKCHRPRRSAMAGRATGIRRDSLAVGRGMIRRRWWRCGRMRSALDIGNA